MFGEVTCAVYFQSCSSYMLLNWPREPITRISIPIFFSGSGSGIPKSGSGAAAVLNPLCSPDGSTLQSGWRFMLTTFSLTAARNRLWVVAPSTLTGHRQEPMRQQQ